MRALRSAACLGFPWSAVVCLVLAVDMAGGYPTHQTLYHSESPTISRAVSANSPGPTISKTGEYTFATTDEQPTNPIAIHEHASITSLTDMQQFKPTFSYEDISSTTTTRVQPTYYTTSKMQYSTDTSAHAEVSTHIPVTTQVSSYTGTSPSSLSCVVESDKPSSSPESTVLTAILFKKPSIKPNQTLTDHPNKLSNTQAERLDAVKKLRDNSRLQLQSRNLVKAPSNIRELGKALAEQKPSYAVWTNDAGRDSKFETGNFSHLAGQTAVLLTNVTHKVKTTDPMTPRKPSRGEDLKAAATRHQTLSLVIPLGAALLVVSIVCLVKKSRENFKPFSGSNKYCCRLIDSCNDNLCNPYRTIEFVPQSVPVVRFQSIDEF